MADPIEDGSPEYIEDPSPYVVKSAGMRPAAPESAESAYFAGYSAGVTAGYREGAQERVERRSEAVSAAYGRGLTDSGSREPLADEIMAGILTGVVLLGIGAHLRTRWLEANGRLKPSPTPAVIDEDGNPV